MIKNTLKQLLLSLLISSQAFAGLPPTTLNGTTTFFTKVPNNQATQISGVSSLIETGNKNYLANPGFSSATVGASWTVTNSTASSDTTNFIDGTSSVLLTLSAQSGTLLTQSISPVQQVANQAWEYSIWLKTTLTTLTVCALQNSAVVSTCPTVLSDGNWHQYQVFYPASSVSNGIKVTASTSSTGTVNADDAYMGPARGYGALSTAPPTVTKLTSTSGTYTPPSGVSYIVVKAVGGGGGGAGAGPVATPGGTGGTGGTTTFGSLISCTGGTGGVGAATSGAAGGACTLTSPAYGPTFIGNSGQGGQEISSGGTSFFLEGGAGGAGAFQGQGSNATGGAVPVAAQPNSGSGGGGAGYGGSATTISGTGGGAGGYTEAVVPSPTGPYSWTNGSAGGGGSGGGGDVAGGAGGTGGIIIYEYYGPTTPILNQAAMFDSTGLTVEGNASTCPSGTLVENGAAISRTTYAHLFAVIGTTFGVGDGSTTFNIPNHQNVFARGVNSSSQTIGGVTYPAVGLGLITADQFQGHIHPQYTLGVTASPGAGPGIQGYTGYNTLHIDSTFVQGPANDGTDGAVRYGSETRPVNIGKNFCIIANGVLGMPITLATAPAQTVYLSGSGTYTTPAGALYLHVKMVGGGGGGSGSGTGGWGTPGAGGNTTFGTGTAAGGLGGGPGSYNVGGTATLGTNWTGLAVQGGSGQTGQYNGSLTTDGTIAGGAGGASCLGGAGYGSYNSGGPSDVGGNAATNSGSGGGGGGNKNGIAGSSTGPGGGSGGCIDALISGSALLTSFSYSIGTLGTFGTAGTNGLNGGNGAAGYLEITAYFH